MPESPHLLWNTLLLSLLESEIHHAACLFSDFSNLRKGWGVGGYLFNTHQVGLLGSASLKMGKIMNAQENSGLLLPRSSVVTGVWELTQHCSTLKSGKCFQCCIALSSVLS